MSDITGPAATTASARIKIFANQPCMPTPSGGARRDRTDDLLLAKQALSQLSYGPGARFAGAEIRSKKPELGTRSGNATF
jgi:hypothetical protein